MNQLELSSDLLDWILENHISRIANEVVENIDIKILAEKSTYKTCNEGTNKKARIKKHK
ncbi:MAG: hypothetical protein SO435_04390 [Peptostreptococcus porci]|nr:hypothetical protein [Peptostreptococcus porci]